MIILDARCMGAKREAHAYLKDKLGFPDYYGNNLDALYECLTDMEEVEIVIEHVEEAGQYFQAVHHVFEDAVRENTGLKVELRK